MNLLVDELKRVASGPNGLDPEVLMVIQRNLVSQVMQLYRDDYVKFGQDLAVRGVSPDEVRAERAQLLSQLVQSEYRHRASNGQGFSLPMYVEVATNHYRVEIQRLGQSLSDYVSVATAAAERHYVASAAETRRSEPGVEALTQKLADQLDKLETALEGLSRVSRSDVPTRELRAALERVFADARREPFTGALVEQARTLAAAKSYDRKHFGEGSVTYDLPGMK